MTGIALIEQNISGLPSKADSSDADCHFRLVPILLQKSFCTDDQKFSGPLTRFSCKDVGDLIA
jgi:hypothetical protein